MRRVVSIRQIALLLDLLEEDRDLAVGRLAGTPLGHTDVANRWAGIAETLNSVGDGATKSGAEWKNYWNELKYKARKRAVEVRTHSAGTGGGRGKKPLSELETRIICLVGQVAVYGNESVRIGLNQSSSSGLDEVPPAGHAVLAEVPEAGPAVPAAVPESGPAVPAVVPESGPAAPTTVPAAAAASTSGRLQQAAQVDDGQGSEGRHQSRRESRRRYIRRVAAGPPQWAQEFENRRLEVDAQAAQAFTRISEELRSLNNSFLRIIEILQDLNERLR